MPPGKRLRNMVLVRVPPGSWRALAPNIKSWSLPLPHGKERNVPSSLLQVTSPLSELSQPWLDQAIPS